MTNRAPLTIAEREAIYNGKLAGKKLKDIAQQLGCSLACVRKWWRIGRDQGLEGLQGRDRGRPSIGHLAGFDPLVAQQALYWKRKHPRRGATRILVDMARDPILAGIKLPKARALTYFFRQECPELLQSRQRRAPKPPRASRIHQLWQIDGKEAIRLVNGAVATVLMVREPVASVCLGAFAHEVTTKKAWRKLNWREIQADLRAAFTKWGLPEGIQTDNESVYGSPPTKNFPTLFTLWLVGLGLNHQLSRPKQPTDQAHVERTHQTIFYWLEKGEAWANLNELQAELDEACLMHNEVLPSRAGDCNGRPPLEAHPLARCPLRPYHPSAELALFDLERVDRFLAQFTWSYKVTKVGQFKIADQRYSAGMAYAGQTICVRFEPEGRQFALYESQKGTFIKRFKAKGLDVATITGLTSKPLGPPIQLSFAL